MHKKLKPLIATCLLLLAVTCLHAEEVIEITDRQVGDYWDFDRSREGNVFPVNMGAIMARHGGEIRWKYTYLIDKNGVPGDFKFISALPKSAESEKDQLRKLVLFYRYKRNPKSSYRGATRVHADLRWWTPDPKTVSF
jgi:hypothetical protein